MSKNKSKSRGSVGTFFFGSFIGFLLCLGLISGVLCFAYFKISPTWLNKTFKTDLDLGSEEANNMTIKDFVTNSIGLVQNFDNYKLSSLKNDFGINIKDEMFGINISDLKDVELSKLSEAIENKFANISADELKNVIDLQSSMKDILKKSNTYYYNTADVNDNKLYRTYKDSHYSNEVKFDYSLSRTGGEVKAKVKGIEYFGVAGEVEIKLENLPIASAFGDFMATMGDNLTLADLEKDFGVDLPSFMDNIDKANTTVNNLESAINGLPIADFLGYTIDKSDPDNIIVTDEHGVQVKGVLAVLSQYTIKTLQTGIDSLTLADIFAEDEMTGVLSLIDNPKKVTLTGETDATKGILSITDALAKVIEDKNLGQLADAGLISYSDFNEMRVKWIDTDLTLAGTNYVQVQTLTLNELLEISLTVLDEGGLLLENKPA